MFAPVNVEATTESPLATGADTIVGGGVRGRGRRPRPAGRRARHPARRPARPSASSSGSRSRMPTASARSSSVSATAPSSTPSGRAWRPRWRTAGRASWATGTLCWEVPHHVGDDVVEGLVEGTLLHAYRFERYKPSRGSRQVARLVHERRTTTYRGRSATATIVTGAQNRARDLGNTPANDLPPSRARGATPRSWRGRLGVSARRSSTETAIREARDGRVRRGRAGLGSTGPADPARLRRHRSTATRR